MEIENHNLQEELGASPEVHLDAAKKRALGEPAAYLITGSRIYKDTCTMTLSIAEQAIAQRGNDGSRIEPLYRGLKD